MEVKKKYNSTSSGHLLVEGRVACPSDLIINDELIAAPVFITSIWKVAADDDGDLSTPSGWDMEAGGSEWVPGPLCSKLDFVSGPAVLLRSIFSNGRHQFVSFKIKKQIKMCLFFFCITFGRCKGTHTHYLLELLHGNLQGVRFSFQFHHDRCTHPVKCEIMWRTKQLSIHFLS